MKGIPRVLIWPVLVFAISYLAASILLYRFLLKQEWGSAFESGYDGFPLAFELLLSMMSGLVAAYMDTQKRCDEIKANLQTNHGDLKTDLQMNYEDLKKNLKKDWNALLEANHNWQSSLQENNAKSWRNVNEAIMAKPIVFRIDMSSHYSTAHIQDINNRLAKAFGSGCQMGKCPNPKECLGQRNGCEADIDQTTINLYAIDATDPHAWWSESMLGYLAVQAKWKAEDSPPFHKRQISRLFVWAREDLLTQLGEKLITLHRLLGFDTYVILRDNFPRLRTELLSRPPCQVFINDSSIGSDSSQISRHFGLKEFVAWDCCEEMPEEAYGYRSYWNLLDPDNPLETDNRKKREGLPDVDALSAPETGVKWRNFKEYERDWYPVFFREMIKDCREVKLITDFANQIDRWVTKKPIYRIETADSDQICGILSSIASEGH